MVRIDRVTTRGGDGGEQHGVVLVEIGDGRVQDEPAVPETPAEVQYFEAILEKVSPTLPPSSVEVCLFKKNLQDILKKCAESRVRIIDLNFQYPQRYIWMKLQICEIFP